MSKRLRYIAETLASGTQSMPIAILSVSLAVIFASAPVPQVFEGSLGFNEQYADVRITRTVDSTYQTQLTSFLVLGCYPTTAPTVRSLPEEDFPIACSSRARTYITFERK